MKLGDVSGVGRLIFGAKIVEAFRILFKILADRSLSFPYRFFALILF
jgi:hypothetical protein